MSFELDSGQSRGACIKVCRQSTASHVILLNSDTSVLLNAYLQQNDHSVEMMLTCFSLSRYLLPGQFSFYLTPMKIQIALLLYLIECIKVAWKHVVKIWVVSTNDRFRHINQLLLPSKYCNLDLQSTELSRPSQAIFQFQFFFIPSICHSSPIKYILKAYMYSFIFEHYMKVSDYVKHLFRSNLLCFQLFCSINP